MSVLQLNPLGMLATEEGYIVSITIRSGGADVVFTPDGNNMIGIGGALPANVFTRLLGSGGGVLGPGGTGIKMVTG